MTYFQHALVSLLETIIGLYLIAAVLRFLLELLRVDFHNPLVRTIATITNPPLRIVRRFIPELYGLDLAAVVLIWFIELIKLTLRLFVADHDFNWSGALIVSLANGLNAIVWVLLLAVLIRVVISWVAPGSQHPAVRLISGLSEPVMAPFRRLLPSFAGLDLSPILTLMALRLVQQLLLAPLLNMGAGML